MTNATTDATDGLEEAVRMAQQAVEQQGDVVRGLKAELKDGRSTRVRWSVVRGEEFWEVAR